METKILKAVFGGGRYAVTNKRTRTDYGQVLEFVGVDLPDTFECIFSNSATSAGVGKKMIGSNQRVLIPDEYLKTGQTIYAWVLVHDSEDDGRHMYNVKIPVDDMPDLSPEEPTPVEQSVISQAITALNSAVTTTSQKAQEATESADRAEQAAEGAEGYAERAEAAQSASESARDLALESKVSAQASAATATEKASEAISSATTASQSALTAETASESAQEYATASAESASASAVSASQASEYASTAGSKATEASGYASSANTSAQTASQKASEAAQSASTAVQAKTDAITAKTASETAQGLAESARDGAVSAKTGAESARDEAQDIVDGITGKVEQIDSNTERIESLEDDRYKPYPTDSVSGSIASFPDGADGIPLKSCIVRVEPVQEGSGDPSPDNVRPITGWTGVEVQRTGKNLWSFNDSYSVSGYTVLFDHVPFSLYPGTYTFSAVPNMEADTIVLFGYHEDGTRTELFRLLASTTRSSATKTVSKPIVSLYFVANRSGTISNIQLELGSTATKYEPYSGQTYDITFPSEAGTVYGGTLDVTKGELVVDRAMVTFDGTRALTPNGKTSASSRFGLNVAGKAVGERNILSNMFYATLGFSDAVGLVYGRAASSFVEFYLPPDIEQTTAAGKAWFAENPTQLCYELATPITYQLTPTEIRSLLGTNNIWADTGDTEVEYRADTKLYIQKKIAEAISALS